MDQEQVIKEMQNLHEMIMQVSATHQAMYSKFLEVKEMVNDNSFVIVSDCSQERVGIAMRGMIFFIPRTPGNKSEGFISNGVNPKWTEDGSEPIRITSYNFIEQRTNKVGQAEYVFKIWVWKKQ